MHARFDVGSRKMRRKSGSDAECDRPAAVHEAATPNFPAVDRDRHDGKAERAIESGKTRLERRSRADANAGAFGENEKGRLFSDLVLNWITSCLPATHSERHIASPSPLCGSHDSLSLYR